MLAGLFVEMLQRDFGYRIYKMLLSLPEKVVSPPEPEKEEAAKEEVVKEEEAVREEAVKVSKAEVQDEGAAGEAGEAASSLVSTAPSPGPDETHIVVISRIPAPLCVAGAGRGTLHAGCIASLCYPGLGDGLRPRNTNLCMWPCS